ncbi:MAG: HAMP domain-containing protein, partial [Leptospiraceae bacterium]|nr:HAMP domain-containing protein [Leptospiraceae bacterium]
MKPIINSLSLGAKIGIAVFCLALSLSSFSGLFYYYSTREFVLRQMGGRLMDVGRTGAYLFDEKDRDSIAALKRETAALSIPLSRADLQLGSEDTMGTLTDAQARRIMRSPDFLRLIQRLRQIKDGSRRVVSPLREIPQLPEDRNDQPLVRFAYLLVEIPESPDRTVTKFLADADFEDADVNGDGIIESDEQGNPVGTLWQTPLDEFRRAFDGEAQAASEWYTDSWGTWLSAAIPIKDKDGHVIAVLGLDYDIRGEANLLIRFQRVAIGMVLVGVLLSFVLSVLIARLLASRLRPLTLGVARLSDRDFSVQIPVKSNDEVGQLSYAFNDMVSEIRAYSQSLEALNKAFERFVPREFLIQMGHESVLTVSLGDAVIRDMTVMFCDIRSFTAMSEKMSPAENFQFLNEYLSRISPIIRENRGFIDKYIGDAVMALFPGTPLDALRAAEQMQMELAIYNHELNDRGRDAIRFGIGIHYGQLMLGAVGEDRRMESTVISDTVNIAARLEQLTKRTGVSVLVSEKIVQLLAEHQGQEFETRYL